MEIKPKILVCIAFHHIPNRIKYVDQVVFNYSTYNADVDIIIDSNVNIDLGSKVISHKLEHPYHLTWIHRQHFLDNIDNYDYFMYVEDDMLVPYECFQEYISNFDMLWDLGCVPSFIRIEEHEGKQYVTDVCATQDVEPIMIGGKMFATLSQPYHAFWIMPQKALKESISPEFVKLDTSRENAASYPIWGLHKKPLVRIENNQVSRLSYSYHLTNNYATNPNTYFGKVEVKNILK